MNDSNTAVSNSKPRSKSQKAFRTIKEVAEEVGVEQHVLRFWETKFKQITPIRRGGGRRYYRPEDVVVIEAIKNLLHNQRYTIEGVQNLFKTRGDKNVVKIASGAPVVIEDSVKPQSTSLSEDKKDLIKASIVELSSLSQMLKKASV